LKIPSQSLRILQRRGEGPEMVRSLLVVRAVPVLEAHQEVPLLILLDHLHLPVVHQRENLNRKLIK
jgi:hypothetical protein